MELNIRAKKGHHIWGLHIFCLFVCSLLLHLLSSSSLWSLITLCIFPLSLLLSFCQWNMIRQHLSKILAPCPNTCMCNPHMWCPFFALIFNSIHTMSLKEFSSYSRASDCKHFSWVDSSVGRFFRGLLFRAFCPPVSQWRRVYALASSNLHSCWFGTAGLRFVQPSPTRL